MGNRESSFLPAERRAQELLGKMTLKEKIGQLNQRMFGWNAYEKTEEGFELTDAFKEEVAQGDGVGALYGLFRADPWSRVNYANGITKEDRAKVANSLQKYVIENTRLGIPLLLSEECPHGHMALDGTMLPTNLAVGATFNPGLYEEAYTWVAKEIRTGGAHLGLVSALDVVRDPRWGRTEECYGEDPFLSSQMAAAVTRGLQGQNPSDLKSHSRVVAVLKHFCAQGASFGGRNGKAAAIGDRELREIHLPPMEAAIKAGAMGCMAAYNEIDGVYCHSSRRLLTEILREEWGFEGLVMSDGCAVDNLISICGGEDKAVAAALNAGVDLNLWSRAYLYAGRAVEKGFLSEAVLDEAVKRILTVKFHLGLFDNPYTEEAVSQEIYKEAQKAGEALAEEGVVLLKNSGGLLPLSGTLTKIAVIGPNGDNIYNQLGDYTPIQREHTGTTVVQGIKELASPQTQVLYAKGCGIRNPSREGFPEALAAAAASDVVVLALGGSSARSFDVTFDKNGAALLTDSAFEMDCGEGMDAADLELGGVQLELAKEIVKLGKPVIAVLIQGRPHAITWLSEKCDAILLGWYPGKEGGKALARILFGAVNPSGKLSVSIPRSSAQLPVYYNHKESSPYLDVSDTPLYPFGYGLSYTSFEYGPAVLDKTHIEAGLVEKGEVVSLSVTVTNTGSLRGKEAVQLYVTGKESGIGRRVKELKAFEKVELAPGESRRIAFRLGKAELGFWDEGMRFGVKPGKAILAIGPEDKKAVKCELTLV